jgi:hypothetical protein
MFGFIKKLKPVYEIPEPLSVRERALKVFSNIEGMDDVKEMMFFVPPNGQSLLLESF